MDSCINSAKTSKVDPSGKEPQHQTGEHSLDFIPCQDDLDYRSEPNKERSIGFLSERIFGSTTTPATEKVQIDKKHLPPQGSSAEFLSWRNAVNIETESHDTRQPQQAQYYQNKNVFVPWWDTFDNGHVQTNHPATDKAPVWPQLLISQGRSVDFLPWCDAFDTQEESCDEPQQEKSYQTNNAFVLWRDAFDGRQIMTCQCTNSTQTDCCKRSKATRLAALPTTAKVTLTDPNTMAFQSPCKKSEFAPWRDKFDNEHGTVDCRVNHQPITTTTNARETT